MTAPGATSVVRHASSVLLAALAVGALGAAAPLAAQSAGEGDGEVPRTAWGDPDLQGNWTNATLTPLQRPEGQDPVLSPEEAAQIEGQAEEEFLEDFEPSDPDRGAPPVGGDGSTGAAGGVGGYNRVYIDRGERVAVVDGEPRSSLLTRPEDGRIPGLTEEGRQRIAEARAPRQGWEQYDHPEMRPLGERCIISFGSMPGPPMLPNGFYNNNYTIVQTPDHVMIMSEMVHDVRVIRLDEADPLPDDVTPWFGDSRGWWEGDTLVVETTNINPQQTVGRAPASEDTRVVERFTRVADDRILYDFTVEDPAFEEPWGGQVPMHALDERIYEYACHEGNHALRNVLSGARYQERQEQEAQEAETQETESSDER